MVNATDFYSEEAYYAALEEERAPLATPADACREYARNVGIEYQDREWILTDYDSWERNPYYTGKPGRHPEDDTPDHDEDVCTMTPGEYLAMMEKDFPF